MTNVRLALPKPEVRGVGHVRYRCADCGGLDDPSLFDIRDGHSFHRKPEACRVVREAAEENDTRGR